VQGRTAVVTGGGSGLGRAIALELAGAGACVVAADLDLAGAEQTASRARSLDGEVRPLRLDVSDSAAVDEAFAALFAEHGGALDCLVNNAGTDRGAEVLDVTDEQWHSVFAVNVHGPMYTSRAFLRGVLAAAPDRAHPADVLNVVSISALTVGAGAAAYNSSKAALLKLTEVLQTEVREHGWPVRVTALNPAAMDTPMMEQWSLPQGRMMRPEDVARMVRTVVCVSPDVVVQSLVITPRVEYYPR
jgi:3-oxoacyl-[acyl-carrier protein] reductase